MSTSTENPVLIRISILGDEGIGKDIFINKFTSNQFLKVSDTGLGVAFYKGSIKLDTNKGQQECIIWIWDLKEREGYKNLHSRYLKGTNGIMLFFDLTNRQSFNKLLNWIETITNEIDSEIPILLVGNREKSGKFVVSPKEINKVMRKFDLYYIETSLTTDEGIYDSFYCITSLTLGVEVDHEFFLSKDITYYPRSKSSLTVPSFALLTSQDLSNLSQRAIFKRIESLEKTFEKSKQIKIPLKTLIIEVVLSIVVILLFIVTHFLQVLEFPGFTIFVWQVTKPRAITFTFWIALLMQMAVIIPIIISYFKHRKK